MATITKPYTYSAGSVIVAAEHNSNFDTVYNDYNGNITNANVAAAAAIAASKLSLGTIAQTIAMSSVAMNWAKGSDITSASTTDLGAMTGNYADVTGNTGITALGTVQAGTIRFVRFTGTPTITHNGTSLMLPTAANITAVAGDTACFVSLGSGNWKCLAYQRYDGSPLVATTVSNALSGSVIQTVNTQLTTPVSVTATVTFDDTPPLYSEGTVIGSLAITPNHASNNLLIRCNTWLSFSTGINGAIWLCDATGSDAALAVRYEHAGSASGRSCGLEYYMAAGTTSEITFYLLGGRDTGTIYAGQSPAGADWFGAAAYGSITIQEIKA